MSQRLGATSSLAAAVGWLPLLLLLLLLQACQTGAPQTPVQLAPVLAAQFQPCAPGDGAASLQLAQGQAVLGRVDLNWIARSGDDWHLELADPLGRSLLQVQRQGPLGSGHELRSSGPLAAKLPPLAVDAAGQLLVDGHASGLKASEVPCLLGFHLPQTWLAQLLERRSEGAKTIAAFADSQRSWELTATPAAASRKGVALALFSTCTEVSWHEYLVLSRQWTWCLPATKPRTASLRGFAGYQLTWVQIDD